MRRCRIIDTALVTSRQPEMSPPTVRNKGAACADQPNRMMRLIHVQHEHRRSAYACVLVRHVSFALPLVDAFVPTPIMAATQCMACDAHATVVAFDREKRPMLIAR